MQRRQRKDGERKSEKRERRTRTYTDIYSLALICALFLSLIYSRRVDVQHDLGAEKSGAFAELARLYSGSHRGHPGHAERRRERERDSASYSRLWLRSYESMWGAKLVLCVRERGRGEVVARPCSHKHVYIYKTTHVHVCVPARAIREGPRSQAAFHRDASFQTWLLRLPLPSFTHIHTRASVRERM